MVNCNSGRVGTPGGGKKINTTRRKTIANLYKMRLTRTAVFALLGFVIIVGYCTFLPQTTERQGCTMRDASLCRSNIFLQLFSDTELLNASNAVREWRHGVLSMVELAYNSVPLGDKRNIVAEPSGRDHQKFNYLQPMLHCPLPQRVGADGDGGKLLCNPSLLRDLNSDCVVYSLGSRNDFSFEQAIFDLAPQCEMHTFDCTLEDAPSTLLPLFFHPWCIDGKDSADERYLSMATIYRKLGGKAVTILKMDIEGFEYQVMRHWRPHDPFLPHVLFLEVHARSATTDKNAGAGAMEWGNPETA